MLLLYVGSREFLPLLRQYKIWLGDGETRSAPAHSQTGLRLIDCLVPVELLITASKILHQL